MKKLLCWIQGTEKIGLNLLRGLGLLGVIVGVANHFTPWYYFKFDDSTIAGYGDTHEIGIWLLVIIAVLLLLRSVYSNLPAALYSAYVLEQVIGNNLLRYMPFESTRLTISIYCFLPMSALLVLLGGLSTILFAMRRNRT